MSKRDFGSIKCLVHFDFPYFNEPNDGLDDDVGIETWSKENDKVALWGSEIPVAGTRVPKFGYRCLHPYTGGAVCTNNTGIWNMNSSGNYEIEFFVCSLSTRGDQYLLRDADSSFIVLISYTIHTSSNYIQVKIPAWGVNNTPSITFATGRWYHILLRVSNNTLKVFINGEQRLSKALTPNVKLSLSNMRLGSFSSSKFFIDEFVFRHSAGSDAPTVPTRPYSGSLNIAAIGGYRGYGTIDSGSVTINSDSQLNSYGMISSITDVKTFTVTSWSNGLYPAEVGCEVMIHITAPRSTTCANYPLVGLYAFARVVALDGTNVTLRKDITTANGDDFTLDNSLLNTYYVQVIVVPRFTDLTVDAGVTVNPLKFGKTTGGGIAAFRVTGDCTINGSIITTYKGTLRYDWCQMTNSKLIDRFLCSQGGGIFIICGGTLTISSAARLGATWSGAGDGDNGAAGYGGRGGDTKSSTGGAGGVGGGGGGAVRTVSGKKANGGAVGANGSVTSDGYGSGGGGCGGSGGSTTYSGGDGGCQGAGKNINATDPKYDLTVGCGGGGGGAPGGYSTQGVISDTRGSGSGAPGASIILVCKKLNALKNAISTGGGWGGNADNNVANLTYVGQGGGGGTGFCYIACEEQVS